MQRQLGDTGVGHGPGIGGEWWPTRGAWSLAAILLTVNAACGGYRPVPEFDPGDHSAPVPVAGTPLVRRWQSRPVRGPSAPVALDSLNAYIGGADRRVAAVDLASGRVRWAVRLSGPVTGGVRRDRDAIFAATDRPGGRIHALRAASGSRIWARTIGYVEAPLALAGRRVIALTRTGEIVALDAATGTVAWRRPLPSARLGPQLLDDRRLLVTAFDSLYLVGAADGRVLLRRRAPGPVVSPWIPAGGSLVAGSADSEVVALDPDSLTLRWRVRLDAPVLTSPVALGDTLLAVTRNGSIWRIVPAAPGGPVRLHRGGWAATGTPSLAGSWLLVGGSDGALRAFDPADGAASWSLSLSRPVELAPLPMAPHGFLAIGGGGDFSWLDQ